MVKTQKLEEATAPVLLSGFTGFVGRNLRPFLEKNQGCYLLGRWGGHSNWDHLATVPHTLSSYIHLAGKAHDTNHSAQVTEYFKVNTFLTTQLFKHFLKSQAHTFIFMSSVKAAADTVEGNLFEDIPPTPLTPYGQSKLKAEEYMLKTTLPEGKRVIILRPCMIHGPGNKGNLNLLYKVVQKSLPWPLAAFHNQRSFLSIANLCYVIERLIQDQNIPSGVYNVADDEALSTNELIGIMAKSLSIQPRLLKLPPKLIEGTARLGDVLKLPLNSERLKKLTESYVVSNAKLKKALQIDHMPVSARAGMADTLKSFQK